VSAAVQVLDFTVLAVFAYGIFLSTGDRRAFRIGYLAWVVIWMIAAHDHYQISHVLHDQIAPVFQPSTAQSSQGLFSDNLWRDRFESVFNAIFKMLLGFVGSWITVLVYRKRGRMLNQVASQDKS